MSNPLDSDVGSENFEGYSAEFRLVEADLAQKLDQIPELTGEPRKAAITSAERALEEAEELVSHIIRHTLWKSESRTTIITNTHKPTLAITARSNAT